MRTLWMLMALTILSSGCSTHFSKEFDGSFSRDGITTTRPILIRGFYSGTVSNRVYAEFLLEDQQTWFFLLFPTNAPARWPAKPFTTGPEGNRASVWLVKRQRRVP